TVEHRLDDSLRRVELEARDERGSEREVWMREGVIADLMSLARDAPRDIDVRLDVLADHEERRGRVARAQRIENDRRPHWVGAVVERERNLARLIASSRDYIRKGLADDPLAGNDRAVRRGELAYAVDRSAVDAK